MTETKTETKPKRYQCRHIFTDGHRCGSICLRGEEFCYYHHTTRKPAQNPRARRGRRSTFDLPVTDPNDRTGLQSTIVEVLRRIASNDIDPRRAGLLLYGLQIASLNLPKPQTAQRGRKIEEPETVEEITTHPELGILAPKIDIDEIPGNPKSAMALLLEAFSRNPEKPTPKEPELPTPTPQPTTLPTVQATAQPGQKASSRLGSAKKRPSTGTPSKSVISTGAADGSIVRCGVEKPALSEVEWDPRILPLLLLLLFNHRRQPSRASSWAKQLEGGSRQSMVSQS